MVLAKAVSPNKGVAYDKREAPVEGRARGKSEGVFVINRLGLPLASIRD